MKLNCLKKYTLAIFLGLVANLAFGSYKLQLVVNKNFNNLSCYLRLFENGEQLGRISHESNFIPFLYVGLHHRSKGYGTFLFKSAIAAMAAMGTKTIWWEAVAHGGSNQEKLERFYKRLGGERSGPGVRGSLFNYQTNAAQQNKTVAGFFDLARNSDCSCPLKSYTFNLNLADAPTTMPTAEDAAQALQSCESLATHKAQEFAQRYMAPFYAQFLPGHPQAKAEGDEREQKLAADANNQTQGNVAKNLVKKNRRRLDPQSFATRLQGPALKSRSIVAMRQFKAAMKMKK